MKREIRLFGRLATLALLLLCVLGAKAQTDYTGTYYIGSAGTKPSGSSDEYYLCPTDGWCFYKPVNNFAPKTETAYPNPFLTTYPCKTSSYHSGDPSDAWWNIEKAPAPDSNYYYIKQTKTGKYLLSNGQINSTTNPDRLRVHLEAVNGTPDDRALFTITPYSTYLTISPKNLDDGTYYNTPPSTHGDHTTHKWLVVNGRNKKALTGQDGKGDGPTGYTKTAGIIGIYTQNDQNAPFYLEAATIASPIITNNFDGTITITAATGATIYYTTDESTPTTTVYTGTGTTSVNNLPLADNVRVIKAIAKADNFAYPTAVRTYYLPVCERPVITVDNSSMATITCQTAGASIYYTTDDTPAATSSTSTLYNPNNTPTPFDATGVSVIRAIATKPGYIKSSEVFYYYSTEVVHSSSEITNMNKRYSLASDFTSTASVGTASEPFKGYIDGNMVVLSGLDHPFVAYAEDATIKNVFLDNVNISSGTNDGNVGAICGEATGASRIYNCGVLATNSTITTDEAGYTTITFCSSTISGSNYVGGIVGLLDGSSRVINCFSYANITGGDKVGGIVGYNNVATTASNPKTMVMNCMFYGDIDNEGCASIAPIYNGEIITNDGDAIGGGVNNFNYFRIEASYVQDKHIDVNAYNCALAAETRFLQRFEFFRHLLNSNRALAAWWVTGNIADKDEIMKWVLEPDQIGTSTPYPILKKPGKFYPSVVNYKPSNVEIGDNNEPRNEGRKLGELAVHIQMGSGGAVFGSATNAAITKADTTLIITDKDPAHFNFNYGKVQLPYYNQVGTNNYRKADDGTSRVVTGWKIVSITGGTPGEYSTGADVTINSSGVITNTPYNFADRKCTAKDLYRGNSATDHSGRIFNQGAYWDVPDGVSAITIEPYWAKCVYLADSCLDMVYKNGGSNNSDAMYTAAPVTSIAGGVRYHNGNTYDINGESQVVYTSVGAAKGALGLSSSNTVYDYAIVLVGNTHNIGISSSSLAEPYTFMSIDLDKDNEPDYCYILRFNDRNKVHPVRIDFLCSPGLGMAQKSTGGTGTYNFGIMQPLGWFESTNTSLFRETQFEYDCKTGSGANLVTRIAAPYILQGGVMEQWVLGQSQGASNNTTYFHVGGNVWFKEFHRGTHQDVSLKTKHPPVSVTGGDYDNFYLTGLYTANVDNFDDNAECYINGGRFGIVAGAGMEGIGYANNNTGNITWLIDHADMEEFYAGGSNAATRNLVQGNLKTVISNSHVTMFCGGPKFGDMNAERTVVTTATDCTFGHYFGAGYGGNSYSRYPPYNYNNVENIEWNRWVNGEIHADPQNHDIGYVGFQHQYDSRYGGVATQIDYQFLPMSGNTKNCARLWIEFVKFSLATTHGVTSTLKGCTIDSCFYGGGSLGKVKGDVVSVLEDCTVNGNVYGAGYSATLPKVPVMKTGGFNKEPFYDVNLGAYLDAEFPDIIDFTWVQLDVPVSDSAIYESEDGRIHEIYTNEDTSTLGTVTGSISLTLKGSTKVLKRTDAQGHVVGGNVFGGGQESAVTGNTTVTLQGNTTVAGNVYGGGDQGAVSGDSSVTIEPQP